MKIASGGGRPASAAGAAPSTTSRSGTPRAAALRAMRSARSARASMAIARLRAMAQHPFDRRPSRRRRRRPRATRRRRGASEESVTARISALGDLAVMLEQPSSRPGGERHDARVRARPSTSIATRLSGVDRRPDRTRPPVAARIALARAAQRFEHGEPRRAEAAFASAARRARAGRRAVPGQRQDARARLQMRTRSRSSAAAVQR